jgi:hypothetical protein
MEEIELNEELEYIEYLLAYTVICKKYRQDFFKLDFFRQIKDFIINKNDEDILNLLLEINNYVYYNVSKNDFNHAIVKIFDLFKPLRQ